jgi:hypothetical protein
MHVVIVPILLGSGEQLFASLDAASLGYCCSEHASTANVTHIVLSRES